MENAPNFWLRFVVVVYLLFSFQPLFAQEDEEEDGICGWTTNKKAIKEYEKAQEFLTQALEFVKNPTRVYVVLSDVVYFQSSGRCIV